MNYDKALVAGKLRRWETYLNNYVGSRPGLIPLHIQYDILHSNLSLRYANEYHIILSMTKQFFFPQITYQKIQTNCSTEPRITNR